MKLVSRRPSQQAIEFMELAALALPAHPASLGRVPQAPAMQEQEAIVAMNGP